jgi:2-dehydro-3-deoxygalactonokinase
MPTPQAHGATTPGNAAPVLVGVDWGTTAFRAYLIARNGDVLDRKEADAGILKIADGAFGAELDRQIAGFGASGSGLPVLLSGMVGSRQGWREAPYADLPADLETLARQLRSLEVPGRSVHLVPGLLRRCPVAPDVMRGEEVQVMGAMQALAQSQGRFVLPGTHCKWIVARDDRVVDFFTYMTGEVFAACRDHTILGRLMTGDGADDAAFRRGVHEGGSSGRPGALLHRLFGARTLGLIGDLPQTGLADYLSGLLIGAEIADGTGDASEPIVVVAAPALAERYARAAHELGIAATAASGDLATHAYLEIARLAGMVTPCNAPAPS